MRLAQGHARLDCNYQLGLPQSQPSPAPILRYELRAGRAIARSPSLDLAGFAIEDVAQTLPAMSTSEACRDMSMALDLLAKAADGHWRRLRRTWLQRALRAGKGPRTAGKPPTVCNKGRSSAWAFFSDCGRGLPVYWVQVCPLAHWPIYPFKLPRESP